MQDSLLSSVGNWASILGFFITVGTLTMALNIRKKIEQTLRRQRYQQQRGRILLDIKTIREQIYGAQEYEKPAKEYPSQTILHVRELVLQLYYFKLWRYSEGWRMKQLVRLLEQASSKASKSTAKDLLMALDEIIAIVESHTEL